MGQSGKYGRGWRPYGVALVAVGTAAAARVAFLGILGARVPYLTFFPAVMVAALYGGLPAGLFATALSAVAASYWMEPVGSSAIHQFADWLAMAVYVASCGATSWICQAMHRAQAKAAEAESETKGAVERQQAAEELHRTTEHARFLAEIIESAEQPLGVGYPDGRLGSCNRAFCDLTGYNAEELRSLNWARVLTPPEWLESEMAALAELERTGKPVRYQKEYIHKDGRRVPIELLVHVSRDAAGKTQYYYSFVTDISERKRAEDELRRQREWLSVTLASIGDAVLAVDTEAAITFLNPVATALTGWSGQEALGRPVDEVFRIINEQTREAAENIVGRVLREGRTVLLANHTALLSRDGREIPIEDSAAPIRDSDGKVAGVVIVFHDVTEKRRSREALERNEAQLHTILENLAEGLVVSTLEGEVFLWNRAALDMHGFKSLEECRRRLPELTDTFELSTLDGAVLPLEEWPLARILRGERLRDLEIRVRRLDSDWHGVFNYGGALVRDAEGRPLLAIVSVNDITGRKRLEEQLRERAEELEIVMELAPVAIWVSHDPLCREITGNRMANAFYEAGTGENVSASGTPVRRFFQRGRELAAEELPMQVAAARNIEIRHSELGVLLPSGKRIHMLGHASPLRDDAGRVRGCIGAFLDITERKHAEEALRHSEAVYRAIARNIPDGAVAVVDTELRFTVFDGRLLARFGIQAEQMEGRTVGEALDDQQTSHATAELYRRALAGESVVHEQTHSGRVLSARYVPLLDEQGVIVGAMSLWLDITERKHGEERLRQAQKLESIGLLAGGIAHDFNNLLTGILGSASLLIDDAGPEIEENLRAIIDSAERAAHLTRQLLAYSGKGQFIVKELNLTHAIRDMSDLLRLSIPKSVELRLDLSERLPHVAMDPGQLQQVVMNLVINAGEAIGEGNHGRLAVATGWGDVDRPFVDALGVEAAPGRYVYLEVNDNGSGMDQETILRIFDPFFTTKFTGRGLGLAAVSGVVRSQNGAITVESTPGQGSTFRVMFPAAQTSRDAAAAEGMGGSLGTVLVVDDEESVRRFVSAALRRSGYRVLQAADGTEALALCERGTEPVDAVVLDIVMPVMGAGELLPALVRLRPGVRILLTSGYSESEAKRLCASYEGAGFIQKPYTAQTLIRAVAELLGSTA